MEQVKLKILLSLGSAKNLLFLYDREKEPRSKYRQIWRQFLAYFVCQIGSSPPRPRRYFRVAEIRYLARKQSARDKSILLFRLRRKAVTLGELGR